MSPRRLQRLAIAATPPVNKRPLWVLMSSRITTAANWSSRTTAGPDVADEEFAEGARAIEKDLAKIKTVLRNKFRASANRFDIHFVQSDSGRTVKAFDKTSPGL